MSRDTTESAEPARGICVELPYHLRLLAQTDCRVRLNVPVPVTLRSALAELERRYPALRGTICDAISGDRRPLIRFFACETDLSNDPLDTPLPSAVVEGREPLLIVGAIAGG